MGGTVPEAAHCIMREVRKRYEARKMPRGFTQKWFRFFEDNLLDQE